MIFKKKILTKPYVNRLSLLDNISDYDEINSRCLKREPHTVYNMSLFIKFIKDKNLLGNYLSIGIDPYKEWTFLRESKANKIDVYDIDQKMVDYGNRFWEKRKLKIKYYNENILDSIKFSNQYDGILLFQMDYIFSDHQIIELQKKTTNSNIKNIFVMTPSLFNINNIKRIRIFLYDLLSLFIYLFFNSGTKLHTTTDDKNFHFEYKRTKNHLTKLFKEYKYALDSEMVFINHNGSYNFMHFTRLE